MGMVYVLHCIDAIVGGWIWYVGYLYHVEDVWVSVLDCQMYLDRG